MFADGSQCLSRHLCCQTLNGSQFQQETNSLRFNSTLCHSINGVNIPFREPVLKKYDVVTCIAPLFGNEQWQQALFAAHIYKKYGSHMHLYIRSMVSTVYDLLRIYVDEVCWSVKDGVRTTKGIGKILGKQESASYIAFMDLDDVLIPRLADSYLEEFAHLFHSMPNVAYIHYEKENTRLDVAMHSNKFTLRAMLSTIQFEKVSETGKMVANPLYVNHTWIHHPTYVTEGMDRYTVPNHLNAITHLKHMHLIADGTHKKFSSAPAYRPNTPNQISEKPLLSKRHIDELQLDFERMSSKPEVARIFPTLPRRFIYREVIDQCFEDTYYKYHYSGNVKELKCPGPDRCLFPRGIPCYNSVAKFHSVANSSRLNIHFATDESFKEENGCLP
ncbi:hypothetical protein TELCIR_16668 [Teladorsagia circumcincta]|uniref:Glycosyltransferase family 92 protein n=1 Tax=Teladorsagia circumcincta TaxID=45464 RepID=A0A2G9TUU7_TELCI|nr:hypothetical protein TELCIR_16668 [Teladorsagia circumcincta]